ncbi:MAG TPA: hypothetical protein VLQ48_12990 [Chloroflexia bacterium]|nr:hypothetical protein [Chloroflexia bacterium]
MLQAFLSRCGSLPVTGNGHGTDSMDGMLAFKLLLTPLLIGLISLAERRWGARVGGWLVGLPLTSAPVSLFIALELGTTFTSHMAIGILMGLISQAAFCLTYAWLSFRMDWVGCWLTGWAVFGASTFAFEQISVPASPSPSFAIPLVFLGIISALVLVLVLWPHWSRQEVSPRAPAWRLVVLGRMGVATGLVLLLTSTASLLGPQLSGLLSPLPIFSTVFAVFAHKLQGGAPARQVLHGVIVSSFACAVFFLVVTEFIEQWSIIATFSGATFCALLTQGSLLWILRSRTTTPTESRLVESRLGRRWTGA